MEKAIWGNWILRWKSRQGLRESQKADIHAISSLQFLTEDHKLSFELCRSLSKKSAMRNHRTCCPQDKSNLQQRKTMLFTAQRSETWCRIAVWTNWYSDSISQLSEITVFLEGPPVPDSIWWKHTAGKVKLINLFLSHWNSTYSLNVISVQQNCIDLTEKSQTGLQGHRFDVCKLWTCGQTPEENVRRSEELCSEKHCFLFTTSNTFVAEKCVK